MSCSKCDREVYNDTTECIFHCEKDGFHSHQVKFFQEKFNEIDFSVREKSFIFPKLELEEYNPKQTYYNNVIFTEKLILKNENFFESLKFINCTFKKEVEFNGCMIDGGIDFSGSVFDFTLSLINLKSLKFLNFSDVTLNEVKLTDNQNVAFNCNFFKTLFNDRFEVEKNSFNKLNFKECTFFSTAELKFNKSTVCKLLFDSYINYSRSILFKDMKITEQLFIKDITYTNESFQDLNAFRAKHIVIKKTLLTEKLFSSTVWGKINDKRFKGTKKTFRELKNYSEKSKNFIDAAAFYSLEMRAKKEELLLEFHDIKINNQSELYEEYIFYIKNILMYQLYETTSNYSENWIRPLVILIVFGMFSYLYIRYDTIMIISLLGVSTAHSFIDCLIFNRNMHISIFISMWIIIVAIIASVVDPSDTVYMSTYISPFSLFKITDGNPFSMFEFIQKIIVLLLGYQTALAIHANIRNK